MKPADVSFTAALGSLADTLRFAERLGAGLHVGDLVLLEGEARAAGAQARVERERAMLAVAQLAVQRDAALAWLSVFFAERRATQLGELDR